MTDEKLTVDVTHTADAAVLAVRGEIDMATAPMLRSALERCQLSAVSVVLDFAEVTFMDSTGLGVLIDAKLARADSESLCVRNASDGVRRILDLTGMTSLMCGEP